MHAFTLRGVGAAFATGVGLVTIGRGLARVALDGIRIAGGDDDQQWRHVREHEQRFIAALRAGSSAEGDDTSI